MRRYAISTGKSRKDMDWQPESVTWNAFKARLRVPVRTEETMEQYARMAKDRQTRAKDCGGYVAGTLDGPRRLVGSVTSRSMVTLDADNADLEFTLNAMMTLDCAAFIYPTHSSRPDKPRYRLIIPLDRDVTPDEYAAISRRTAEELGMNYFDHTTFQASRLMYWASVPADAPYEPEDLAGDPLSADAVLNTYADWHDVSSWPTHPKETTIITNAERQEDPTRKTGAIGAFCRTYDVPEAIAAFIPDKYEEAGPNRYTYTGGSTIGGLTIHDGGLFAYSYHDTDPAATGHCMNAFDLVRVHKFGDLDADVKEHTPANRYPSFRAMSEFAVADPNVAARIADEKLEAARDDFNAVSETIDLASETPDSEAPDPNWKSGIKWDKGGEDALNTHGNINYIMTHDPTLRRAVAENEFTGKIVKVRDLPWHRVQDALSGDMWTDTDDVKLLRYMERYSKKFTKMNVLDQVRDVADMLRVHPVRDYLRPLEWDGVPRLDTLLIDEMGAEDTPYVRGVTRKMFAAAVARVMRPGCKFDYMLVLVGPQGVGKSSILRDLGGDWFTDSVFGIGTKEAPEQIQGFWIVELAELAALKKLEVEAMKSFISTQVDSYRAAYDRHRKERPRQCVFFGTTNSTAFLRDETGNRRFWPVRVDGRYERPEDKAALGAWRDQIWAEAKARWKEGERLYLDRELETEATRQQEAYSVEDPWAAQFAEFLDTPIPKDWYEMSDFDRNDWESGENNDMPTMLRDRVTAAELWTECLNGRPCDIKRNMSQIHAAMALVPGWERAEKKIRVGKGTPTRAYIRVAK